MNREHGILTVQSNGRLVGLNQNKFLHVVGLGDAGCNALRRFHEKGLEASFTCITDTVKTKFPAAIHFIPFKPPCQVIDGQEIPQLRNMNQPLSLPDEVKEIFEENNRYILLVGLGGYTGTYMTQALSFWLKDHDKDFLLICSLPFSFEGKDRKHPIENVVTNLKVHNNFNCFALDDIRNKNGNLPMKEALAKADEQFYNIFLAITGEK